MRKTVSILGVSVDSITMSEALETVKGFISEGQNHAIYTPNAEIIMDAQNDIELRQILNDGDMIVPDGAGVVLASRILGRNLPEKVSGIDLVKNILSMEYTRKIRLFFFGSAPGVAEEARDSILAVHPGIEVVGCRNGYFKEEEEKEIIDQINASDADILLVALGAPKQEKFIFRYKNDLKVKVSIGVGGTLDVFAGKVRMAPEFLRKNGLEWLYRLYRQPSRYKRMLKLPRFILASFKAKITKG